MIVIVLSIITFVFSFESKIEDSGKEKRLGSYWPVELCKTSLMMQNINHSHHNSWAHQIKLISVLGILGFSRPSLDEEFNWKHSSLIVKNNYETANLECTLNAESNETRCLIIIISGLEQKQASRVSWDCAIVFISLCVCARLAVSFLKHPPNVTLVCVIYVNCKHRCVNWLHIQLLACVWLTNVSPMSTSMHTSVIRCVCHNSIAISINRTPFTGFRGFWASFGSKMFGKVWCEQGNTSASILHQRTCPLASQTLWGSER